MNKTKELFINSIYFFVGNIGSKFFVFLLVPLYTAYMSRGEYGHADTITNIVNLIVPIVTMSIYEGVFRFALSKEDSGQVLTIGLRVTTLAAGITLCIGGGISILGGNKWDILWIVTGMTVLLEYRYLLSYYTKARGRNLLYVTDSIVYAAFLFITSMYFIKFKDLGIEGYFKSFLGAAALSVLILAICNYRELSKLKYDKILARKIILYSMPIMVNSLAQWIANFSDRIMLNILINPEATGLYAAATKIPSILTTLFSVFLQAWTIASIKDYEGEKDVSFYKKILGIYSAVSVTCASVIIVFSDLIMKIYVGVEFREATCYVPLLVINSVVLGYVGFYGAIYSASKQSKGVAKTTIYAAIVNVLLNIWLIPALSIMGAIVATLISHVFFWIYRIYDTRKLFMFSFNKMIIVVGLALLLVQSISYFQIEGVWRSVINLICCMGVIFINKSYIIQLLKMFTKNKEVKL